ncbi:hypothetical protein TSC_c04690 [Thermus scotoductus SA-01]|uniref:Uncharacterized protein n=1 Tax=Thermus scotoductus (strain ATCC 700910 / SA-01) TaxID=743525 RepID=E8PLD8_THESS|nr:hypothetical protein TSC_c04690 [Thermus scotoductus SA-01]
MDPPPLPLRRIFYLLPALVSGHALEYTVTLVHKPPWGLEKGSPRRKGGG